MGILEILRKENLEFYGQIIIKATMGILGIIMLALFLIALIIDKMITYTFPAFTLIAGIISITLMSCKVLSEKEKQNNMLSEQLAMERKAKETIQDYFRRFNHLPQVQIKLLERIANENTTTIYADYDTANIAQELYYNGFDFIKGCGENVYISQFGLDLIKKYFNK